MASAQWCDNYTSTLSSGYSSGGTSLVVTGVGTGASTLPTSGDYYVIVEAEGANSAEVFKVTARSGTTLTVVGANAGTGASNHGSGATIRGAILTKAAIDQLTADILAAAGGGGSSVTSMTVAAFDTETTSGTVQGSGGYTVVYLRDSFYTCVWNGSAWEYYCHGLKCTLPVSGDFAWVNQGTSSVATGTKAVFLLSQVASGVNLRIRKKSLGSLPVIYTMGFTWQTPHFNTYCQAGFVLRESATGKLVTNNIQSQGGWQSCQIGSATGSIIANAEFNGGIVGGPMWLQYEITSTNRISRFSSDGINFMLYDNVTKNTNFTTAPDEIGYFVNSQSGSLPIAITVFHWSEA